MLRLAESLVYENDSATAATVSQLATAYVGELNALAGAAREAKKDEAKSVQHAWQYLAKFNFVPTDYAPKTALDAFITAQRWDVEKK
jgi:hypothetical protein